MASLLTLDLNVIQTIEHDRLLFDSCGDFEGWVYWNKEIVTKFSLSCVCVCDSLSWYDFLCLAENEHRQETI